MRRSLALLALLLVSACGSEVKVSSAAPSPTESSTESPSASSSPSADGTASPAPPASGSPTASASPSKRPVVIVVPTATGTTSPAPLTRDARQLVGWWHVQAPAAAGDLGLGESGVVVHPCGASDISWAASPSGLFVAAGYGGDSSCYEKEPRPDLGWLEKARSFAVSQQQLVLRDDSGTVVAYASREKPPSGRKPMTLTPALAARLKEAPQLPKGVRPVSPTTLEHRWVPTGKDAGNGKAYVTYGSDGTWSGSDGCNGAGGHYALGDWGEYLTTSGPSTLIGCKNSPAPLWAENARRLGLDSNGALVLYDEKGAFLGRLSKA